jgi:hypothetical protein
MVKNDVVQVIVVVDGAVYGDDVVYAADTSLRQTGSWAVI